MYFRIPPYANINNQSFTLVKRIIVIIKSLKTRLKQSIKTLQAGFLKIIITLLNTIIIPVVFRYLLPGLLIFRESFHIPYQYVPDDISEFLQQPIAPLI